MKFSKEQIEDTVITKEFVLEHIENVTIDSNKIDNEGYIFTIKNGFFNESVTFGLDTEEIKNFINYLNNCMNNKEQTTEHNEWQNVALKFGELLSNQGSEGYYNFTPDEWFEWAKCQINKKWISIEERLPQEGERVLFYLDDPLTELNIGWWEGKWTNGKAIVMQYGDTNGDWFPCSHWMPLPLYFDEEKNEG